MDHGKSKNVVRLPITHSQRYRNQLGRFAVPSEVSERWFRFGGNYDFVGGGEFMTLDVMTRDMENNPKKICGLIVDRKELLKALSQVKPKDE